jgi:hypothetical protein
MTSDELKSEATASKPRDENGRFISVPKLDPNNPINKFLMSHTGNYKDEEDLLDIRIGNPLRRVIVLLEEIRQQKAFSFTLKGSLGVAGVALVLSVFGIFGGGKMFCERGIQSHVGVVKVLNFKEIYSKPTSLISYLLELVNPPSQLIKSRTVLIKNDLITIHLPFSDKIDIAKYNNASVIITGNYNSCSQELTINDSTAIETYSK